jgi:hypothetical protein
MKTGLRAIRVPEITFAKVQRFIVPIMGGSHDTLSSPAGILHRGRRGSESTSRAGFSAQETRPVYFRARSVTLEPGVEM